MPARFAPNPETLVVDQMRTRWLAAILEFGPVAARNDAVAAFMQRMGCSRALAEDLVDRAWSMLNLAAHTRHATIAREHVALVDRPAA